MTFDSVPWVVTMKKNEHYFPTVELIKDPNEECGWRRVTYEGGKSIEGEGQDGLMSAGVEDSTEMDVDVGVADA
jgi:pro-apoptotic serine protease NMA111